jgi:TrmH family RNA methyltransferase
MLSKNKIKLINSLSLKKFRDETGLFTAEGIKLVTDLISGFECELLIVTEENEADFSDFKATELLVVNESAFGKISAQKNPQGVLGVFKKKNSTKFDSSVAKKELVLMLDDVQDPGNLGTIIRIADWFGIRHIVCSENSADAYGQKVVQATMGALSRVSIHYANLSEILKTSSDIPVYGTFLEGNNIYEENLSPYGFIIMGNEGNGISAETEKQVTNKLLIPCFPADLPTSESLNVAVATAIVCSEFRRR